MFHSRWSLVVSAFLFFLFTQTACASNLKTGQIYSGVTLQPVTLASVVESLEPGSVLIVSEQHGFQPHHRNQVRVLDALAAAGVPRISVGMEFLARKHQSAVDLFLDGKIGEADFLKSVEWGGNPFSDYATQVLFPSRHAGRTVALNADRKLTSKISKGGISSLSPEDLAELPPNFTLGNALYFERFREVMKDHVPESAIRRYFEAQSVWDETMAWSAAQYMARNPDQRLVIIVGDFHASHGGGLPDRLVARGVPKQKVVTLSQVNFSGLSEAEEAEQFIPHPKWGPRAEFIWIER
jgi:uncharacterized iron-regulated protein